MPIIRTARHGRMGLSSLPSIRLTLTTAICQGMLLVLRRCSLHHCRVIPLLSRMGNRPICPSIRMEYLMQTAHYNKTRICRQAKKSQAMPGFFGLQLLLSGSLFLHRFRDFRTIDQFDESHRRIVTLAETHFQDAQIAAVAVGITRAKFGKQLDDDVAVAQTIE